MKKIGIIGASGFIGTNLTEFFLEKGYSIVSVGRSFRCEIKHPNNTEVVTDIFCSDDFLVNLKDCTTIIWLVNVTVPSSTISLAEEFLNNTNPVIKFLEKSNDYLPLMKKFIYLSSGGTVYGNPIEFKPLDEEYSRRPISAYGLSKLITENCIEFLTHNKKYESFILRPSNVYGKYQNLHKPQGIIGFAFRSIILNKGLELYDDGKVIRDFIYVRDLADAILKCIEIETVPSKVHEYNIGSGNPHTIKEIIQKISIILGEESEIINKESRNFDCLYNVLDITKINKVFGWQPKTSIDEGLRIVAEWYKKESNA